MGFFSYGNKLYRVKPTVGTGGHGTPSKRRDDLVLTRGRSRPSHLPYPCLFTPLG
ncbi:hypothetical protein HOLleu_44043 [Holothuria leucospilota]|uniref:Uncharacterized protein n=1 Tax=Holothuria leucospilota TaxID=206669 RepID=A0A9Q0YGA8_HOLLE|nr:hypothetical protein HOLleu_44043 [Holothuria leucospilota]